MTDTTPHAHTDDCVSADQHDRVLAEVNRLRGGASLADFVKHTERLQDQRDAAIARAEAAEAKVVAVEALADDWERRGEYGDVSLTWGASGIRSALADGYS